MKVVRYNPNTLAIAQASITGIDFGLVNQGGHSVSAVLLKPAKTSESAFTSMKMFLQSKGGFNDASFGYYKNASGITGIVGGDSRLSDNFTVNENPSITGAGALTITAATPEFIWLDVQAGSFSNGFTKSVNYQFVYEFT
jgi:hypothetical protein